jgi:putative adhesin
MPKYAFDTPDPILVSVEVGVGTVRIVLGDGARTTVEVEGTSSDDAGDQATAEQARVHYADGTLTVVAQRAADVPGLGSVRIRITVPSGSRVHGAALAADFTCEGSAGECLLSTGCGHLRLGRTGALRLSSVLGDIAVDRATGDVQVIAGCGGLAIRQAEGAVDISKTMGDTRLGTTTGAVYAYVDHGNVHLGRAHAAVEARTTEGDLRVDETVWGPVVLETASGGIEIGIPEGTGSTLDLGSDQGTVYRSIELLDTMPGPHRSDPADVKVYARTIDGDIVVRRAAPGDGDWT